MSTPYRPLYHFRLIVIMVLALFCGLQGGVEAEKDDGQAGGVQEILDQGESKEGMLFAAMSSLNLAKI